VGCQPGKDGRSLVATFAPEAAEVVFWVDAAPAGGTLASPGVVRDTVFIATSQLTRIDLRAIRSP
jgi:hypothetical protein